MHVRWWLAGAGLMSAALWGVHEYRALVPLAEGAYSGGAAATPGGVAEALVEVLGARYEAVARFQGRVAQDLGVGRSELGDVIKEQGWEVYAAARAEHAPPLQAALSKCAADLGREPWRHGGATAIGALLDLESSLEPTLADPRGDWRAPAVRDLDQFRYGLRALERSLESDLEGWSFERPWIDAALVARPEPSQAGASLRRLRRVESAGDWRSCGYLGEFAELAPRLSETLSSPLAERLLRSTRTLGLRVLAEASSPGEQYAGLRLVRAAQRAWSEGLGAPEPGQLRGVTEEARIGQPTWSVNLMRPLGWLDQSSISVRVYGFAPTIEPAVRERQDRLGWRLDWVGVETLAFGATVLTLVAQLLACLLVLPLRRWLGRPTARLAFKGWALGDLGGLVLTGVLPVPLLIMATYRLHPLTASGPVDDSPLLLLWGLAWAGGTLALFELRTVHMVMARCGLRWHAPRAVQASCGAVFAGLWVLVAWTPGGSVDLILVGAGLLTAGVVLGKYGGLDGRGHDRAVWRAVELHANRVSISGLGAGLALVAALGVVAVGPHREQRVLDYAQTRLEQAQSRTTWALGHSRAHAGRLLKRAPERPTPQRAQAQRGG